MTCDSEGAKSISPVKSFQEVGVFPPYLLQALVDSERTKPMPIQAQALPIVLSGHDLIGIAKTGSGKTLAFLLPAIVHMEAQKPVPKFEASPIVLILAPTRELVQQIASEAGNLLINSAQGNHPGGLWAQEVYGGKQRQDQLNKAKGASLIAATPGRLTDFINTGEVALDRVTYFALDEADRMLDMGFQDEVQNFSNHIRADRHTLFFSATWPKHVQELANNLCQNSETPMIIRVGQTNGDGAGTTRSDIDQKVIVFDEYDWNARECRKKATLYSHLNEILKVESNKALVFVSSKVLADEVAQALSAQGFSTESMHGGRKQWDRDEILENFKRGQYRLLVATDVMGRGLDIPTITHVVIYDMGDIDDYIHRIGRTARGYSGLRGDALTLFEYNQKWPELAGLLCKVLEDSGQEPPTDLKRIAQEVENGERDVVDRFQPKAKKLTKTQKWNAENAERQYAADGNAICNFFLAGCCTNEWCNFVHKQPGQ